jgi:hypothetical protein
MAGMYSDIPELAAEQEQIARRRRIAEMLQQQALEPTPNQIPQRGFASNTALPNAVAKIAQAYFGNKKAQEADTAQGALGERAMGMQTGERQKIVDALTPKEEVQFKPDMMPEEQNPFGKLVESSAKNQTPQDQLQSLLQAGGETRFPANQKWVDTQQKYLEGKINREDNQQARAEAARIAAEAKAAADKDRKAFQMALLDKRKKGGGDISNVDARSIDKSMTNSSNANSAMLLLDQAEALYGKYQSGRDEPISGPAARWASIGIDDKQHAENFEIGNQISKDLGVIKLGLIGGSDTERELQVAIDTSPSPDKLPSTNKKIIDNQRLAIQILQAEPDFKTEWVAKNGSLSKLDADTKEPYGKAWRRYQKENFKPIKSPEQGKDRRATDNQQISEAQKWASDPANANHPRLPEIRQKLGM